VATGSAVEETNSDKKAQRFPCGREVCVCARARPQKGFPSEREISEYGSNSAIRKA
jgi:hypothetical protein